MPVNQQIKAQQYTLCPYVELVVATDQALLYNLHSGKLLAIELVMGQLLEQLGSEQYEQLISGLDQISLTHLTNNLANLCLRGWLSDAGSEHITHSLRCVDTSYQPEQFAGIKQVIFDFAVAITNTDVTKQFLTIATYLCTRQRLKIISIKISDAYSPVIGEFAQELLYNHLVGCVEIIGNAEQIQQFIQGQPSLSNYVINLLDVHDGATSNIDLFAQVHYKNGTFISKDLSSALYTPEPMVTRKKFVELKYQSIWNGTITIDSTKKLWASLKQSNAYIGKFEQTDDVIDLIKSLAAHPLYNIRKIQVSDCKDCGYRFCCTASHVTRVDQDDFFSRPQTCMVIPTKKVLSTQIQPKPQKSCQTKYFNVNYTPGMHDDFDFSLLDRMIEQLSDFYLVSYPEKRVDYTIEARNEDAPVQGLVTDGVFKQGKNCTINSTYPCHTHELGHMVLYSVNSAPNYYLGEAAASVLGVRNSDKDYPDNDIPAPLSFDNNGSITCKVDDTDVFLISKSLYHNETNPHYFDISLMLCVNHYVSLGTAAYIVGGAFVNYLVKEHGQELFLTWYATADPLSAFKTVYGIELEQITANWIVTLADV
jgi:hypothetical protein